MNANHVHVVAGAASKSGSLWFLLFVLSVALASCTGGGSVSQRSRAGPTVELKRPQNIVVVMTDDQDYKSLPVMRKLMAYPEGSWVNFTGAYVNDSICGPTRATFLTGQYSHATGVIGNSYGHLLDDKNTLPVWLDKAGYRTGLVGKYLNHFRWDRGDAYVPPGWDSFFGRPELIGDADKHTDRAVAFIRSSTPPFFLHVPYPDPHHPAVPVARYANADVFVPPVSPSVKEQDVSDKPTWIRKLPLLTPRERDQWNKERVASQRTLLAIDDGVQRIVDILKATGQLDNTMIVFLADSGFSWGEHRKVKKHCANEECSRFPLLIRYPGLEGNREESRIVSNVDLVSTFLDVAQVTPGLRQDGRSLLPVITNSVTDWHEEALLEVRVGPERMFYGIRIPWWMYAEYDNGDRELYDMAADPHQLTNLAGVPAQARIQAQLSQRLHDHLARSNPPRPASELRPYTPSPTSKRESGQHPPAGVVATH
jgi:arylsulfatase A-like enzyme